MACTKCGHSICQSHVLLKQVLACPLCRIAPVIYVPNRGMLALLSEICEQPDFVRPDESFKELYARVAKTYQAEAGALIFWNKADSGFWRQFLVKFNASHEEIKDHASLVAWLAKVELELSELKGLRHI